MISDDMKQGILKDHETDELVCDALGIDSEELKACVDDNEPETSMFK